MTDAELEALLGRYRPVGPGTGLRRRLLVSRVTQWLPAAVAFVLAALLYLSASTQRLYIGARLPAMPPITLAPQPEAMQQP